MAEAEQLWLIEHEDGIRRSWLGASGQRAARAVLAKLQEEWDDEDTLAGVPTGGVTMRSYEPEQYETLMLSVHRREAEVRGEDPGQIHLAAP